MIHRTIQYKTVEETQFKFYETLFLALCLYIYVVFINREEDKITRLQDHRKLRL